jgi:hypothetical protein
MDCISQVLEKNDNSVKEVLCTFTAFDMHMKIGEIKCALLKFPDKPYMCLTYSLLRMALNKDILYPRCLPSIFWSMPLHTSKQITRNWNRMGHISSCYALIILIFYAEILILQKNIFLVASKEAVLEVHVSRRERRKIHNKRKLINSRNFVQMETLGKDTIK